MGRPRDLEARDRILAAAYDLITTPGADASINAIVNRAGVGKATVYRWWNSRTAVVLDAFIQAVGDDRPPADSGDPWGDVRSELHYLASDISLGDYATVADLLAAALAGDDDGPEIRETLLTGPHKRLEAALARAQAAGLLRDEVDPHFAADVLSAPIWLAVISRDTDSTADRLVERVMETIGQGLLAV